MSRIGIAGAGVLGRLLAFRLAQGGHEVTVFDPANGPEPPDLDAPPAQSPRYAAGFAAAGLLSPLAQLELDGADVMHLGWRGLALWRDLCRNLPVATDGLPLVRQRGSIMVAHPDAPDAPERLLAQLREAAGASSDWSTPRPLTRAALQFMEPAVATHLRAWLLPAEAQVLPREMLRELCEQAQGVHWRWHTAADTVTAGTIALTGDGNWRGQWAVDCRGAAAVAADPQLLRAQTVWLKAPGVPLTRPLRLLHPDYRVDLLPRPGGLIVVSALDITRPAALAEPARLLALARTLVPGLIDAHVLHLESAQRPAVLGSQPRASVSPGLMRFTGLHHNGWLLAPALVEDVCMRMAA